MADFVESNVTKSAVRELAEPIADVAAFGKNEQVKRVFWILFVAMAGLVLAQVVDPVTAQQIIGIITGMGV
ncbi:MAG: hypothetical protein Q7V05_06095 [Methanoregula sp.]|nr:hypothetical protein [Methanoregula sp.]